MPSGLHYGASQTCLSTECNRHTWVNRRTVTHDLRGCKVVSGTTRLRLRVVLGCGIRRIDKLDENREPGKIETGEVVGTYEFLLAG